MKSGNKPDAAVVKETAKKSECLSNLKQWNLDSLGYDNLYDSGHYVCFNYMREFLEYGIFGVEGLYGMKRDISGNRGDNFRISLYLRYDF